MSRKWVAGGMQRFENQNTWMMPTRVHQPIAPAPRRHANARGAAGRQSPIQSVQKQPVIFYYKPKRSIFKIFLLYAFVFFMGGFIGKQIVPALAKLHVNYKTEQIRKQVEGKQSTRTERSFRSTNQKPSPSRPPVNRK